MTKEEALALFAAYESFSKKTRPTKVGTKEFEDWKNENDSFHLRMMQAATEHPNIKPPPFEIRGKLVPITLIPNEPSSPSE